MCGAGASDAPEQTNLKIEALIRSLSDDSWQKRQQAQDELVQLGADSRPRLLALLRETKDEEVRTRIEAALRQIEENRLTGTSIISLSFRGAHPREVFAEVARQANSELRPSPANLWESKEWPKIDVELDRVPFWTAMKELCAKTGVSPANTGADRDLVLMDRSAANRMFGDAPSVVSGPFLVVATSINRTNYVDLNQPKNIRRNASVQMLVYAEPKMRVLQGSYSARLEEAVDDKGNSLLSPSAGSDHMQGGTQWVWNLSAPLVPQADTGERMARLKGSGRFLIQTRSASVEIDNILNAKSVTRAVGGRRFTLKEVKKSGELYIAEITLFRAGWQPNEWNYQFPYQTFKMVDAKGVALMRVNQGGFGAGGDQVEARLQFQRQNLHGGEAAGAPVKLIWEVPVQTREVVVPFEFRDLPLP